MRPRRLTGLGLPRVPRMPVTRAESTGRLVAVTSRFSENGPCPCGSGRAYRACCGPLHDGEPAATAEALMRARYAAYATGRTDYVFRSWHPRTRPAEVEPDPAVGWRRLEVLRVERGGSEDDAGTVEFRAHFARGGEEHVLHETSRFERRAGRWVYVDGDASFA